MFVVYKKFINFAPKFIHNLNKLKWKTTHN